MTREDFQYELEALHNEAMRIIHVGHSFDGRAYTPCEAALYDEMIGMLDARIRTLQICISQFTLLDSTTLWWAASVMRNWSNILNRCNLKTTCSKRTDSCFSS